MENIINKLLVLEEQLKIMSGLKDYTKIRLIFELGSVYSDVHSIYVDIFEITFGEDKLCYKNIINELVIIENMSNLNKISKKNKF